jgi:hypothetical protein
MDTNETEKAQVEGWLLNQVKSKESTARPREVVMWVKQHHGIREDLIRAVMWRLIDRNALKMNRDWTLSIPSARLGNQRDQGTSSVNE